MCKVERHFLQVSAVCCAPTQSTRCRRKSSRGGRPGLGSNAPLTVAGQRRTPHPLDRPPASPLCPGIRAMGTSTIYYGYYGYCGYCGYCEKYSAIRDCGVNGSMRGGFCQTGEGETSGREYVTGSLCQLAKCTCPFHSSDAFRTAGRYAGGSSSQRVATGPNRSTVRQESTQ